MSAWSELKQKLIETRGSCCEYCQRPTPAPSLEAHHFLFHRDKRFPFLDVEQNVALVCHDCHSSGVVNSYKAREWFWDVQSKRYDMIAWIDGLPLKVKPNFGGTNERRKTALRNAY